MAAALGLSQPDEPLECCRIVALRLSQWSAWGARVLAWSRSASSVDI